MERFDVAIVGAGPAGSTAAIRLARVGARVLLLDKAKFPRDKPCGGGLTVRALRQLPVDPAPVVEHVVDRFEFRHRYKGRFVRGGRQPLAYMTQRRRLDNFLAEQAAAAGAEFRDGVKVTEVDQRGLRLDGERIEADAIVGADGANGITARSLGFELGIRHGVAFEGNLAYGDAPEERWRGIAALELGTVPGGYGWIFPKGDHVNVGVGGWDEEGPTLRAKLRELCEHHGLDESKVESLRGHRLPLRRAGTSLARGRVLLVGDAGGLVDPLSGDGMYEAFVSSRLAAAAVLDLLRGHASSLEPYTHAVTHELGQMAAASWDVKIALDRYPRLTVAFLRAPLVWSVVEKVLTGELKHPGATRGLSRVPLRLIEGFGRLAGAPGTGYRLEARTA